jgi:putative heme-binding domain-containing protein
MSVFAGAVGSSSGPTKLTAEQMKLTVDEVVARGDAQNGERVFRRADTNCYQCHAIAGAGGFLAPDLSGIGATAQPDYLINSVLDPGKDIKDGYDGYAVVTKSGDVYSGIKVLQDSAHLVLRDNTHQAIQIPLPDVKSQKSIGSLMPAGLADPLTHQEFLDLIKFLSQLGKPGPYGPTTAQLIRKWEITAAGPETGAPPPGDNANWTAAYALFSGTLPADSLATRNGPAVYARGQVEVVSPGKVRFLVNDVKGTAMWVDAKPVDAAPRVELDLARGIHTLLFRVDGSARGNEGLRVEVADAPGSSGHAQAGGGR